MSTHAIELYELLPSIYRLRDAEQGYPLKALLEIIAEQIDILRYDMDGLYDDLFIETCRDWVVPYIGDLVGNNPIHEIKVGRRADVAKTISYRRRKGVLPMLEELARDVTGWKAHAVAAFELVGWSQNVNHLRNEPAHNPASLNPNSVSRVGTVNLRDLDTLYRLDGPFDTISHSVDVRPVCRVLGRHSIRKVNFFLWRLENYPMESAPAKPLARFPERFYFSTLGSPIHLFTRPELEAAQDELATERHVPAPIRPEAFRSNPSDYYGTGKSLAIYSIDKTDSAQLIPVEKIRSCDLSTWSEPPAGYVAVDVRTGRIAFAKDEAPEKVSVDYNYGFSADIGGGPYDRSRSLTESGNLIEVHKSGRNGAFRTLNAALKQWKANNYPPTVIRIMDNGIYGGQFDLALPASSSLTIEAANGVRPTLRTVGNINIEAEAIPKDTESEKSEVASAEAEDAHFSMNGILIQGALRLQGKLEFQLHHCTMVPGRLLKESGRPFNPDLDVLRVLKSKDDFWPTITIDSSIVGPLRLSAECPQLTLRDSIVDAPSLTNTGRPAIAADDKAKDPGPPASIERCTVWGKVYVKQLKASESIFNAPINVVQQEGCVRFCYVPFESQTPRRYQCQPDLALDHEAQRLGHNSMGDLSTSEANRNLAYLQPVYTSLYYGDPAYAQLGYHCPIEICQGAEDGSEMGVFSSLQQTQRETNLRARLEEYLPFGLEPGLIYVT